MDDREQFCCGNSICCEGLPGNSTNISTNIIPSLVTQNQDHNGILNVYTIDQQPSKYRCRIPKLQHLGGVHVHDICHGWMILSNYPRFVMWSLWNPATSKLIRLPPLLHKDDLDCYIESCCLSSPPGDPSSILLLTRSVKSNFVFCRLVKRKKSRLWTEMSYAKQLKRIGEEDGMLHFPTCCNGKVYAISDDTFSIVQIDIKVVKDKQVVITIMPFQKYPFPYFHTSPHFMVLKGSGTELFAISGRVNAPAVCVNMFKLDMTTTHDEHTPWEVINDLSIVPISYIPAVASGLGGYVHVRDDCSRMIIHSFHVKDETHSLLTMPCLLKGNQVTLWEYRGLEAGNDRQVKCANDRKQQQEEEDKEKNDDPIVVYTGEESCLLDVPFHVLEMIMEHCVGIEYINLRATCKRCHLAAPRIHWRNNTALRKLQKYSLVSPWLMVVEQFYGGGGIMNFTDPISGDKYLMKLRLPGVVSLKYYEHNSISCSKYGWLLFYTCSGDFEFHYQLVFFNPFTNDVRKLPPTPPDCLKNLCFSAPPTSGTDCMVVGFSVKGDAAYILRYVDQQEEQLLWHRFNVDGVGRTPYPYDLSFQAQDLYDTCFHFPTFHGGDLYALCYRGQLVVFKDMSEGSFSQPEVVSAEPPECPKLHIPQYFLMERDRHLLLVIVDMFGGDPQLFQFNDSTKEWNRIESLERHVIFIGEEASCVCLEAKTPKMQNKIYFPRFKHGKLIFYSLETSKYHSFDGELVTKEERFEFDVLHSTSIHLSLHAWIEPTCQVAFGTQTGLDRTGQDWTGRYWTGQESRIGLDGTGLDWTEQMSVLCLVRLELD
ncbi:hypothetical protein OSB04_026168 [Centaurea solstitialis]|uniref:KIB1-4 beta-propeller domain-containing protein n=1 Tax=Centaurea solstitialis TaxID=347529 RepID=A0AA38VVD2_9ASTR|nr:hypothetical protein OSB04_026168 [Centaurea solstitialis]